MPLLSSLGRVLVAGALCLPIGAVFVPSDAAASVSIAVGFEILVKDADAVAVVTPLEQTAIWEDGRIYTYTKVKVDQGVAGDVGVGSDGVVRTMGGVVGKIGQLVDGEPVLTAGKPALLFLRSFKAGGVYEVSARAQGQFPVVVDEITKSRKLVRSSNVGMLYPPKTAVIPNATQVQTQSKSAADTQVSKVPYRLAGEVIHDRSLDDAAREIAATWRRLHPPPAK